MDPNEMGIGYPAQEEVCFPPGAARPRGWGSAWRRLRLRWELITDFYLVLWNQQTGRMFSANFCLLPVELAEAWRSWRHYRQRGYTHWTVLSPQRVAGRSSRNLLEELRAGVRASE